MLYIQTTYQTTIVKQRRNLQWEIKILGTQVKKINHTKQKLEVFGMVSNSMGKNGLPVPTVPNIKKKNNSPDAFKK